MKWLIISMVALSGCDKPSKNRVSSIPSQLQIAQARVLCKRIKATLLWVAVEDDSLLYKCIKNGILSFEGKLPINMYVQGVD